MWDSTVMPKDIYFDITLGVAAIEEVEFIEVPPSASQKKIRLWPISIYFLLKTYTDDHVMSVQFGA